MAKGFGHELETEMPADQVVNEGAVRQRHKLVAVTTVGRRSKVPYRQLKIDAGMIAMVMKLTARRTAVAPAILGPRVLIQTYISTSK